MNLLDSEALLFYLAAVLIIALNVVPRLVLLPWIATALTGVFVFAAPHGEFAPAWQAALDSASASSLLTLILITVVIQTGSLERWKAFFKLIALINSVWILINPWGIFENASMSGCFNVCLAPLFDSPLLFLFANLAAVLTGRSQPIALAVFSVLFWAFQKRGRGIVPLALFALPFLHLDSNGRAYAWGTAYQFWMEQKHYLFGLGLGSYSVFGPELTRNYPWGRFTFLHSDWMQIVFEQGIVGFVTLILLFFYLLHSLKRDFPLFSSLLCFGAFGIANMPLRYPLTALFGAYLVRATFEKTEKKTFLAS